MANNDTSAPRNSLSYKDAGVDIDAGNRLIDRIGPIARKTHCAGVMSGLGGFGSLFELPVDKYQHPVLVAGTDGVGTKLKLAMNLNKHDTIGIDLVAMCVNDIIVQGAEPLFFLDYYATGQLDVEVAENVISGIATGCELAGAALVGGETAEMPGMYQTGDYDLAGFCVGAVEKHRIIDGSQVQDGDQLIGLASSGPHSNGYSLIRKIIDTRTADLQQSFGTNTLGETLLAPTRIYVKSILKVLEKLDIHAISHITGGGITENLPRVLPQGYEATIQQTSWHWPEIFNWLQNQGGVSEEEMLRTFNCGVGMIVCVARENSEKALSILQQAGENAWLIGSVEHSQQQSTAQVQFI